MGSNIKETDLARRQVKELVKQLEATYQEYATDIAAVRRLMTAGIEQGCYEVDEHGIHPLLRYLKTAQMLTEVIAPDRNMVLATLLYQLCQKNVLDVKSVAEQFDEDTARLVRGLIKVSQLYSKQAAVKDDNFQKLLLTFAEDIRVIIIMIIDRLVMMHAINHHPNEHFVREISMEARYLYAPLSHRLGLYKIKSELEDLSLKYLNRRVYTQIAEKLNETKAARDQYVADFIKPIRSALDKFGIKYEIKGRTKTINSIWNKMKKKDVDLNGMYDLFAIRIILDTPPADEKKDCWVVYSIVTDIYTANPSRMRDWITIPKSNGYESLHTTVKGADNKWVEVQIRTKRMDEIAERGLAAHWKYKGIKSEGALDMWMNSVREVLEAGSAGHLELIRGMNMNLYDKEVFVFTPKGDLFRLPAGATVLDFAFAIHTRIGSTCVGARIDGKNQKLNYRLKNGDTIDVLTSSTQTPRLDWLNYVVTSKARNKIKVAVNEARARQAEMAREMLQRRFKNRKITVDEAAMTRLMKRLGYKTLTDFYVAIQDEKLDVATVVERYVEQQDKLKADSQPMGQGSAEEFVLHTASQNDKISNDILIIGNDVKGINYKLSKCCHPIYGDKIVGFIASDGAIKIHRTNCGNVRHLIEKYPYRMIKSQWSGKLGTQFAASLRVVGRDDIGIVANITSVINKTGDAMLRNININSHDGVFDGHLVLGIPSLNMLDEIIQKIQSLKGVRNVARE